ncbi:MAG: WG repeat-containing protein [Bacteroidia bacterium]|nr:WG repeat-containing protein [Bacteroidia bacterium]
MYRVWIIVLVAGAICGCKQDRWIPDYLPMHNGYGLYGFMERDGDEVIGAQFAYAMPFSGGLAAVNVGGTNTANGKIPIDGKWGFVNQYGQFIINPNFYSPPVSGNPYDLDAFARAAHEAYLFSEGLAAVIHEHHWVYIDTLGNIKLELPNARSCRMFTQGVACIYQNGKWGYINHEGEWMIEPQFLYPVNFRDSLAVVMDARRQKIILRLDGKRILPQYRIETQFYEGAATSRFNFRGEYVSAYDTRKFGLCDTGGRALFVPQFDDMGRFGSGMCPVLIGSKSGDPVLTPEVPGPEAYVGGKWGFVDRNGRIVFNPVYDGARGYSEGFTAVKSGDLWGYMNEKGKMITGYEFEWADYFHEGMAWVRLGPQHNDYRGRYALIDDGGDVIWIEPEP